jgi:predicted acetyltransferase
MSEGGLKIGFGVLILQRKKLKKIWILDFFLWHHYIRQRVGRAAAKHLGLVL